ncbi:hypothetical protein HY629_01085 [Candidatus Uhrbacteria bacterium]|nr:hypothetical protein [Candidatus Uhrbacteria bacterium]
MFWHFWLSRHHTVIKNMLNACCWAFVGFGFYLLFIADERFQSYPKFQAGIAFLSVLAMFAPYVVFRLWKLLEVYHPPLLVHLEFLVVTPLTANGIGARWLYDLNVGFDSFVHFTNIFLLGLLFGSVMWLLFRRHVHAYRALWFFIIVALFFVLGILFEAYEQFSDAWFRTTMWGEGHTMIVEDTTADILYDAFGALAAGLFFVGYGIDSLNRWVRVRA